MKILTWNKLTPSEKEQILKRATLQDLSEMKEPTLAIIEAVRKNGDEALLSYTEKFDKVKLAQIKVSEQEIADAFKMVSEEHLSDIRYAIARISAYHQTQYPKDLQFDSKDGVVCEREARAIESVGLYVPAGTAPLVSTVIMVSVPAKVAGCKNRILCAPPASNGVPSPYIIVAAVECGIQHIYKIGGAQAIAAMAYGTQTITKVDKIFGPGNKWVTAAKQLCAQNTNISIDLPAGPSELMVIADEFADPDFVAADLLSQAEHDVCSQVFLVTTSQAFAERAKTAVLDQLEVLPRRDIAQQSLANSKIIVVEFLVEAFEISNQYAPEHLSLQLKDPEKYKKLVNNAASVFLGEWTAETLGDYITGSTHVLPTAGFSRSLSGLSVGDYMKWIGFQRVNRQGLEKIGYVAKRFAQMEQLGAHENAVSIRLARKV
ncbi:MAG: histidinol dehydrogenase [Candidatus Berkiellales bacterium]